MRKQEKVDGILAEVQVRAQLGSRAAALTAVRSVLTSLAERIRLEQALRLARELPREIGMFLEASEAVERIDARELVRRIGERGGVDRAEAARQARVVLAVVLASVSARARSELREALGPDYGPLVENGAEASARAPTR